MPALVSRASVIEFARFLGVGGIAALANLCARYLLDFVMPFEVAVVLAYMVGMVIGFFLFQKMLFGGGGIDPRRVMRFIWVNIFGAALAWAVSSIMARQVLPALGWSWHMYEIAHLCGVAAPAITSYFLHKHYTFAPVRVRASTQT
jgi:putative flippase GtrA